MTILTVATLNLRNRADRWRERRHLMVSQLMDARPDLLALQEIYFPIGQGTWLRDQINTRISGKADGPYHLLQKRKHHLIKGYFEGIGILSRLPIVSHDAVHLGYGGRVALRANVALPTGHTLDFASTHLHHERHAHEARQEQVMLLMGWLTETGRAPLQVVGGDFNEVPDGLAIRQMKQRYDSAFEEVHGYEPLATFPTALVSRPGGWSGCLDYLFISPGLSAKNARLFCKKPAPDDDTLFPSDHVGVFATLEIPEP